MLKSSLGTFVMVMLFGILLFSFSEGFILLVGVQLSMNYPVVNISFFNSFDPIIILKFPLTELIKD